MTASPAENTIMSMGRYNAPSTEGTTYNASGKLPHINL